MKGLSTTKARALLKQFGQNAISEQKKKSLLIKFFEQFNNFLTLLLIIAAALSFFIGEPIDGGLIITIVILNAFFGLYQEKKAEESIAALKKMTITQVRVMRDGKEINIDSRFLVPGDLIYVEEGVKIPADGILKEALNIELNEAVLTGESMPVTKKINDEIYSGTIVATGRGWIEINKTGMQTKFGQIAQSLSTIEDTSTPLQKKIASLTRLIGIIGIVISIIVFVISFLQGDGYFPAFLMAISLAVAIVPEGLQAVMTITLAIGVGEMAKKKSIIRKLSAIEALGSVTLIATDKTGTLTTNKMKVKEVFINEKIFNLNNLPAKDSLIFSQLLLDGVLCSTASLVYVHDHNHYDVLGDPTEGALLYLAQEVGLNVENIRRDWKTIDEKPFDSVTKIMTVKVKNKNKVVAFSKGAPESILKISHKIILNNKEINFDVNEKQKVIKQVENWAKKGLRVLAFSQGEIFLGMVAIHDAPRPEVAEAVKKARQAGIKIVMITGDNEKTAEAIGVTTGIVNEGDEILTGQQLETYDDKELMEILPRVKVFARTNPFQKHRIVKLFQELGEIVAVTGDGVNDAIALKQADVGVAMGLVGTDVARETADMVITDDNFSSIVNAVEEGRNIIKNLKNAIKYLLSCNMTEALALIVGLILGLPHMFYPIQFLYINLVTDGLPALSLAFSPKNPNIMANEPEKEPTLLKDFDMKYILYVGLIATTLVLGGYFIFGQPYQVVGKTAAFTILTLIQSFIFIDLWLSHQSLRKNFRHLLSPLFFFAFGFPILIQYIITRWPLAAQLFKIHPIGTFTYIKMILMSSLILLGIKGVKKVLSK